MNSIYTATILKHLDEFQMLVARGALVVVNHSGGKDSQATWSIISRLVPADQLVVVHADLGDDVEWPGLLDHIQSTTGRKPIISQAIWADGSRKTLLQAIERRGKWPSAGQRYCTSDLKRGPCNKIIRAEADRRGTRLVISCFGFRDAESTARAKKPTWSLNKRQTNGRRDWYEFSPIHDLSTDEVFALIDAVGQKPHWAYEAGMERLSCSFCVLASRRDLQTAAKLRPDLYRRYRNLEQRMGHTFHAKASLAELVGTPPIDAPTQPVTGPVYTDSSGLSASASLPLFNHLLS